MIRRVGALAPALLAGWLAACGPDGSPGARVVTFPASALGAEAELLRRQTARFERSHPGVRVELRATPDAADQRHQLYVQWLNAGMSDPDVLQLDVIWTAEFAAAGWILPLDRFAPALDDWFPATLAANRWRDALHALPWFVDVGMLYWRSDLMDAPPDSLAELHARAARHAEHGLPYGLVLQAARYEGLVTVFLEYLGGFGGRILDERGRVVVDSPQAVRALELLAGAVGDGVPREVLSWQEEPVRFAFQSGRALFMRNWPYAHTLLAGEEDSRVAGRFAVAPMPAAPGGTPTATLGGAQLAVNARSDVAAESFAFIDYLTQPEQMRERARELGHYPPRPSLYREGRLEGLLAVPPDQAERLIGAAMPRPVTPMYTELSRRLQVHLHRALSGQREPAEALRAARRDLEALLERSGLASPGADRAG